MYKLVNKFGNDIVIAENERKRDRLLDMGYKEIKEEKPKTPKTEGKKNGKENKAKS